MRSRTMTAIKSNSIALCGVVLTVLSAFVATAQEATPVRDSHPIMTSDQPKAAVQEFPDSPGATVARSKADVFPTALKQSIVNKNQSASYIALNTSAQSVGDAGREVQNQGDNKGERATAGDNVESNVANIDAPLPDADQTSSTAAQAPVGTAAAGVNHVSGVAAAEPTGVAIATGKQRRVRTIVLRVGAIVGAGVAVGSVVALTEGTPSKPPGAH